MFAEMITKLIQIHGFVGGAIQLPGQNQIHSGKQLEFLF
jgi:hypothetical protein